MTIHECEEGKIGEKIKSEIFMQKVGTFSQKKKKLKEHFLTSKHTHLQFLDILVRSYNKWRNIHSRKSTKSQ